MSGNEWEIGSVKINQRNIPQVDQHDKEVHMTYGICDTTGLPCLRYPKKRGVKPNLVLSVARKLAGGEIRIARVWHHRSLHFSELFFHRKAVE